MDVYEATNIVFSRIQNLDPENAKKIMGLLLIQDHGDKEMIRLAFGPEAHIHSLVLNAKKDLGLLPPTTTPSTPSTPSSPSPFLSSTRPSIQNSSSSTTSSTCSSSSRWLSSLNLPHSMSIPSPTSWAAAAFPRNGASDDLHNSTDELISPNSSFSINSMNMAAAAPVTSSSSSSSSAAFYSDHLIDEFQLQDQLSFLNDTCSNNAPPNSIHPLAKTGDLFYPDADGQGVNTHDSMLFPYGNWAANGHRRSFSVTDICLGSEAALAGAGFGWKPCLYFARGYCKNGTNCRFLHGLADSPTAAATDVVVEPPCQELLLRSKSQRLATSASQFMTSASFPYTSGVAGKCMNYLLQQQQQQQTENTHRAAALVFGDEAHKFGRSRMDRGEFGVVGGGMVNPGSRQIYLTFPADSTFREEDVSNYFSMYGPVQDVRIPYQQKRMFGFVTFVYPETVKLILAKGNPHFVCDARVLVKPYKEKGKVPDKKQQQQQQAERGDFSACTTPSSLDSRDAYDMQLGARMFYNSHEVLMKKLEEAELQQAIELQGRRLMGLQLLDVKRRNLSSPLPSPSPDHHFASMPITPSDRSSPEAPPPQENCPSPPTTVSPAAADQQLLQLNHGPFRQQTDSNASGGNDITAKDGPKEDTDFQESMEHNLPDNPFASPTKSLGDQPSIFSESSSSIASSSSQVTSSSFVPATSTLEVASFKSCFFQMPRFSSGHGAIGM
ncbi:zinc finger CCCH domain-containing protein 53-like isoform X2 [Magnolia sinica]|uniref:zinc finger CCCH domain-containing protein 53-like isoform X2 n=1 Tax=Magnolia sinica TaxID=86752 RepID=UPI0026583688|nr:zinc finger CCCH domain-containing protein 53-like isoform X2 [Magnolia sinica]